MRKIVRIVALMLVIVLAAGAVGCGEKKAKIPEHMSEPVYNYGKKAVEIIDDYLDFKITTEEAHQKIQDLMEMEEALPNPKGDNGINERAVRSSITSKVLSLYSSTMSKKDSLDKVIAKRNELAKTLGLKER